jgi:hypothetical protein
LGEYLDNYENYNESNNIKTINISNIYDGSIFQIEIDYAYIKYNNGRTFFSDTNLIFYLEQGIILASDGYQMSINEIFFKKQIEDKLCFEKQISFGIDDYTVITCKENVNLDNFPILNFEIGDIVFTLNKDDLFKKIGDIYYFLIVFSPEIKNWVIGKPFLRKYELSIDINEKKISFYYNNNNDTDDDNNNDNNNDDNNDNNNETNHETNNDIPNNNKSHTWVIVLVTFIVIIILVIAIFIFIRFKKRKEITSEDIDSVKGSLIRTN